MTGLSNLILREETDGSNNNRGFAFLEMDSHAAAAKALKRLTGGDVKFGTQQAKVGHVAF